jgi:hypothetical protein
MELVRLATPLYEQGTGRAAIVSVFPFAIPIVDPGLPWIVIPACEAGEPYARYDLTDRVMAMEKQDVDGTYLGVIHPARQIAESVIRDCHPYGIFVAKGDDPTEEELAAARATMTVYARRSLNQGHAMFQQYRHTRFISRHSIWAAEYLHEKPEWAYENADAKLSCPSCKSPMPASAAKCGSCQAVVDWNRAAAWDVDILEKGLKFGLVDMEEVKRIIAQEKQLAASAALYEEPEPGDDALSDEEQGEADTPLDPTAGRKAAKTGKRLGR